MLTMSDTERAYLTNIHALTKDRDGDECLAGLTVAESNFLLGFRRQSNGGISRGEAEMRLYLRMVVIHEKARLEIAAQARLEGADVRA